MKKLPEVTLAFWIMTAFGGMTGFAEILDDEVGQSDLVLDDQEVHAGRVTRRVQGTRA